MKNRIFLIAITILAGINCLTAEENLSFKSFDMRLGLSSNTIRNIAQDKYGFIWIATDEGLNRLSGTQVQKFYKLPDAAGLSGNELNCLLDDPDHSTMWVGTQRAGIIALNYDTGIFKVYRHDDNNPESLITDDITSMIPGNDGSIWISTYWHGVECFDPDTDRFRHFNMETVSGLECNQVWCIVFDEAQRNLYVGHESGGFSIIDTNSNSAITYTDKDGLSGMTIRSIMLDGDNIWLGTNNGLCLFKRNAPEFISFGQDDYAYKCTSIKQVGDDLWVAMERKGVVAFDKRAHTFHEIMPRYTSDIQDVPEMLYKSDPTELFLDSFGNILVGTTRDGMAGFSTNTSYFFIDNHMLKQGTDLSSADISAIVAAGDNMWYGTTGNGILTDNTFVQENTPLFPSSIAAMIVDRKGNIWYCDPSNSLTEYNPTNNSLRQFDLGVPGESTRALLDDGKYIYIGTDKCLLHLDKQSGQIVRHVNVGKNFIRSLRRDTAGKIIVGTFGDGLMILDRDLNVTHHHLVATGFPSNSINDIYVDGGSVWVATSEGLVKFDIRDYTTYTVVSQPYRSVVSLIGDDKGNLWYSTGTGIGVVKPTGEQLFFDRELPILGFNNNSVAKDSNGRLYFGTNRGVLTFEPEFVLEYQNRPAPVISDLVVHGHKKESDIRINPRMGNEVDLNYKQNSFTLYVNTLDFFFQKNTFEYRLVGLENTWYELKEGNEVTFRDLPYGKYRFEIRNSELNGADSSQTVSLKIHIKPPLWLQWWAKAIYIIILIGVAYYIIKLYKRRVQNKSLTALEEDKKVHIQQLHEERLRFYTNITHELRTPLTLIMGPLEDMSQDNSLGEKDRWKLQVIHKNAQRLLNLVNQILDFRKTETQNKRLCVCRDNIVATVREVTMKYIELNRNQNVTVSITSSTDDIPMYYDREVLTIILDNLISNAIKYTEVGMISVSVVAEQNDSTRLVRINVKDTGYGISSDALPHIFNRYYQEKSAHQASGTGIGLALVKALVDLHQGTITVESAKDVGTSFSITLDRDNEYPEAMHTEKESADEQQPVIADVIAEPIISSDDKSSDSIVVLIVEDNTDILEYVEQSFAGIFEVRTATNGRDGLEIARSIVPDIIVTDVMMPVMDGMEMCRLLKNDMITSHIPIIMLTAKDSATDREAGYKIGVDSYLTKPFNSSLLLTRINNIISQRHMVSEYFKSIANSLGTDSGGIAISDEQQRLQASLSRMDREFVDRIDSAIIENLSSEKVNIDYLTDCMSRATLYRKVKALTGMSPNEYIRQIRMRKAKEFMLAGDMTITEISDKVGCSSPKYFREQFKAVYGLSPSDWLKTLRQPE